MSLKTHALTLLNRALRPTGAQLVRRNELARLERAVGTVKTHSFERTPLPDDAEVYLVPGNPRLLELKERYRHHPAAAHSLWTDAHLETGLDLRYFRGDNVYVWQARALNEEPAYLLSAYYLLERDGLGLLGRLEEDGLFGAAVFEAENGLRVSRDLLDSVNEILFLERHLSISARDSLRVLDVGAGYGRLAHRLSEAFPAARVLCTDAVAESTFICEYYLGFRGLKDRSRAVPLDEVEGALAADPADLATNIHSFTECSLQVIGWWLDLFAQRGIRNLLIVPNPGDHGGTKLLSREPDRSKRDFLPEIERRGYRLVAREPKYAVEGVQRHGVSPTWYYLFELAS